MNLKAAHGKDLLFGAIAVIALTAFWAPFLVEAQYTMCYQGNPVGPAAGYYSGESQCNNDINNVQPGANCVFGFSCASTQSGLPTVNTTPSPNSNQSPGGGVAPNYAPLPQPSSDYTGPKSTSDVINLVNNILYWISGIFWLLALIFVFYAAFLYLTAGGESERVSKAHNQLKWAVVAIVVGLMTAGLPYLINQFLAYH